MFHRMHGLTVVSIKMGLIDLTAKMWVVFFFFFLLVTLVSDQVEKLLVNSLKVLLPVPFFITIIYFCLGPNFVILFCQVFKTFVLWCP